MEILDGSIVASTVPSDVLLTFDEVTQRVSFTAPFPVVIAVTSGSQLGDGRRTTCSTRPVVVSTPSVSSAPSRTNPR
jgi:hypothetical protein